MYTEILTDLSASLTTPIAKRAMLAHVRIEVARLYSSLLQWRPKGYFTNLLCLFVDTIIPDFDEEDAVRDEEGTPHTYNRVRINEDDEDRVFAAPLSEVDTMNCVDQ